MELAPRPIGNHSAQALISAAPNAPSSGKRAQGAASVRARARRESPRRRAQDVQEGSLSWAPAARSSSRRCAPLAPSSGGDGKDGGDTFALAVLALQLLGPTTGRWDRALMARGEAGRWRCQRRRHLASRSGSGGGGSGPPVGMIGARYSCRRWLPCRRAPPTAHQAPQL